MLPICTTHNQLIAFVKLYHVHENDQTEFMKNGTSTASFSEATIYWMHHKHLADRQQLTFDQQSGILMN